MACVPGAVIQYAALAARRPRPDHVRDAAPARPALAAATRTVGAAGRRFPRRRPPGRASRGATAPRPPRARGQLQLPLRARAHGAGAQARLARHGLELPLLLGRCSLGGNVVVKWLGEQGASAPVRAAAALSVPFDLKECARALDAPGAMSFVYRSRFLRTLKRKALT